MKKVIFILSLLLIGFSTQAQKKNKNAKVTLEVDGICGMCKKRIETAALKTKGVKFALWNVKSHELKMIIDERKTDVKTIQKSIAAVGHDSKGVKATDEAYNSVHPCCKYRDEEIVKGHNGELKKQKKKQ
ncbi:MAG: cation transporter [Flavobacteriaceae bacterium]